MKQLILLCFVLLVSSLNAQNVIIVIIDGARYTETFGDPNRIHIPELDKLAKNGSIVNNFYNNGITYTSRAIPAIWCGAWTNTTDTVYNGSETQYTSLPSIFEYYRKQKDQPAEQCMYFLKYVPSLWLPSFHAQYGPNYWPLTISEGESDNDVLNNALKDLEQYHPQLSVIYFADVDHYGHSGIWPDYTAAIKNADQAVAEIWKFIQADEFYRDNTVLMVTNDHGRHDNDHGGFKGHGCGCDGCRHIMFLAIGPGIKKDYEATNNFNLIDVAVTAASILDIDAEYADGKVINDIFSTDNIFYKLKSQQLFYLDNQKIVFETDLIGMTNVFISDIRGKIVYENTLNNLTKGQEFGLVDLGLTTGIYIVSVRSKEHFTARKVVVN